MSTGEDLVKAAAEARWQRGELSEVERKSAAEYHLTDEEAAASLLCSMSFKDYDTMRRVGSIRAYRRHVKGEQGGAR